MIKKMTQKLAIAQFRIEKTQNYERSGYDFETFFDGLSENLVLGEIVTIGTGATWKEAAIPRTEEVSMRNLIAEGMARMQHRKRHSQCPKIGIDKVHPCDDNSYRRR